MISNSLVGLSDWLVAILSIIYSIYFGRERASYYNLLWFYYFVCSAIGCLLGGTYHLFVPKYIALPYSSWLWISTLCMVGVVGLTGFNIEVGQKIRTKILKN